MKLKHSNSDDFESENFLKAVFTKILGLYFNFVGCESFLKSNPPGIISLFMTNLKDSSNFFVRSYVTFFLTILLLVSIV